MSAAPNSVSLEAGSPQVLDLREEALDRTIISLSLPSIIENLMVTAVFFSDALIVGWLRDENALAATVLAGTIMFLVSSPFFAMAIAAASLVSRSWGEHDFGLARKYTGQSLALAFLFSIGTVALALPLADEMIGWMGGAEEVLRLGLIYLRIVLISSLLGLPMFVANSIIRGTGDAKTPMVISLAVNVINIIVSIVLAFGYGPFPVMGVAGVACGTLVARTLGGFCSLGVLAGGGTRLRLPVREFVYWNRTLASRVTRLAFPAMLERFLRSGSQVIFMMIVAVLGTTALAAHNIAGNVESIAFMPALGISSAVSTIVGQAIGARRSHIAEMAVRRTLYGTGLIMIGIGLVFVLFARQGVVVFGATPEVLRLAGIALQISALELPFLAFTMTLAGALRGAGDTKSPVYVMVITIIVFRFGACYLLAIVLGLGLAGVWLATALDWAGRSVGLWWVFKRGVWKVIHEREQRRLEPEVALGQKRTP